MSCPVTGSSIHEDPVAQAGQISYAVGELRAAMATGVAAGLKGWIAWRRAREDQPVGRLRMRFRDWMLIVLNLTPRRPAGMLGPWLDRDHGYVMLPHEGRKPRQLVVFLHGMDGCGEAWRWMADIWKQYLPDAAFIFPDGLERSCAVPGAFRWWKLRSLDRSEIRLGARRATPRLERFIEQVQDALGIAPEATILGGFSQGAMLALHLAARGRRPLAGILAYGGMATHLPPSPGGVRSAIPIFLYHGTRDPIVPFSAFEAAGSRLIGLGFDVFQWAAEGVDHTIDAQGAELAGKLMRRWLQPQPIKEQAAHSVIRS